MESLWPVCICLLFCRSRAILADSCQSERGRACALAFGPWRLATRDSIGHSFRPGWTGRYCSSDSSAKPQASLRVFLSLFENSLESGYDLSGPEQSLGPHGEPLDTYKRDGWAREWSWGPGRSSDFRVKPLPTGIVSHHSYYCPSWFPRSSTPSSTPPPTRRRTRSSRMSTPRRLLRSHSTPSTPRGCPRRR